MIQLDGERPINEVRFERANRPPDSKESTPQARSGSLLSVLRLETKNDSI